MKNGLWYRIVIMYATEMTKIYGTDCSYILGHYIVCTKACQHSLAQNEYIRLTSMYQKLEVGCVINIERPPG